MDNGIIKIDFLDSKIQSLVYDFVKNKNDKLVFVASFQNKKEGFNMGGQWLFNNNAVCDFTAEKNKIISVKVNAKRFSVDVFLGNKKDRVKVVVNEAEIDELMVVSVIAIVIGGIHFVNNNILVNVTVNVNKAKIKTIDFKDIDVNLLVSREKVIGTGKALVKTDKEYKDWLFENSEKKIQIKADNIAPIMHIFRINEDISLISVDIEQNKQTDDKNMIVNIGIEYDDMNFLEYNRPNKITTKNGFFDKNGLKLIDTDINGNWFDILGDLTISEKGIRLEGKIRPLLLKDRLKYSFINKPNMTKDIGFNIVKDGKTFEEFNNNMFVNGIDFSIDNTTGKAKRSFVSWAMDNS